MRESDLLSHVYARSRGLAAAFPHVIVGPGDDCAVVASPSGDSLLLKVDQVVSGRHFRPIPSTSVDLVARKAVARAVSDVAAMGGTPLCALAAATLPPGFAHADDLFDALSRWARHWACPLVGGDIATSGIGFPADAPAGGPREDRWNPGSWLPSQTASAGKPTPRDASPAMATPWDGLVLAITILGTPHPARGPVLRSGAGPGDAMYLTGALGGSLDATTGLGRHLTFEPRLAEARWLCDALGERLRAMMDVSDGLGIDAARLAEASGAAAEIDARLIPLAPGVASWRNAAGDGEDYELLFAAAPDAVLPPACPATGAPITRIGRIVPHGAGAPRCVILAPEGRVDAGSMGWDHGARE